MNLDNLIAKLNNNFSVDAKVLDKLVENEGYEGAVNVDWKYVKNVYNVSNHYNQVCEYKQLGLDRDSEIKVGSAVKGHAVAEILNYLSKFKPEVKVEVKTVSRPKPILKVKDTTDWKARALEAEAELKEVKSLSIRLEAEAKDRVEEVAKLKAVLKQSVLNNIAIMSTMGVEVTQEDLGL